MLKDALRIVMLFAALCGLHAGALAAKPPTAEAAEAETLAEETLQVRFALLEQTPRNLQQARRLTDSANLATCSADLLAEPAAGTGHHPAILGLSAGHRSDAKGLNPQQIFDAGVRLITVQNPEQIADLQALGMMVDVSELSDAELWQALALAETPLVARHAAVSRERQLSAVARNGGVALLDTHQNGQEAPFDNLNRLVEMIGINAISLMPGSVSSGAEPAVRVNLIQRLMARGYSPAAIRKLLGGNLMRLWRTAETYAHSQGNPRVCALASPRELVSPPPADPSEFTFVVLGDAQFDNPAAFNRVVDQVRRLRPAFVIQVGDLIEGYNSDLQAVEREWQRFKQQIAPLAPVPYYAVPGNHDVYGGDERPDAAVEAAFEAHMGPLYYAFNYKNALFVVLNSDSRAAPGAISEAQLSWLRKVLAASEAEHRFVFLHQPPFMLDNGDTLHTLFKAFGVNQVFYGHHHHYHFEARDGVGYTMTNAGGRPGHTEPLVGGYFQLLQVAVREGSTDVAVIAADSIAAQDSVRPIDNYDTFNLTRRLAPDRIALRRAGKHQYQLTIPLNNTSRREVQVYAACGSPDQRWLFTPARLPVLTLAPGARDALQMQVSFADQRRPEGLPYCDLRVPMQTHFGDWFDLNKRVESSWP